MPAPQTRSDFLDEYGDSADHQAAQLSKPSTTGSLAGRMRVRRLAPWIAGVVTLLLLLTTCLILWRVRESLRSVTRKSIESVLAANVKSIDLWLSERRDDARSYLSDDAIRGPAKQLLSRYDEQSELASAELRENSLAETLRQSRLADLDNEYLGWALIDSQARVIASSHEGLITSQLPIQRDTLERIDRAQPTVSRPFKSPASLAESGPHSKPHAPMMIAIAPVTEGVRSVGCLVLLIDPLGPFTDILQVAQVGDSDETYAFDRNGLLLSRVRFEHQLRASGLLQSDDFSVSPLSVYVRDPGIDIQSDEFTPARIANAPLTLMADQATRGATGSNVIGYNDYRGKQVVGAWCWIEEYGFGVTTEIGRDEAFGPMRILRHSFYVLLAVIALAGIGLFTLANVLRWFADHGASDTNALRRLGQYQLGDVIGSGGMGKVYRGRHELLRRDVAVKVLEYDQVTPRSLKRFEREVRMTARLRHPNTIDIYDYGRTPEGTFFYVMEYIEGITLLDLVREYGRQPAERVIFLLTQICGSLSEAHRQSLVHRDVKPANILITSQAGIYDMVKVLDFGLVKDSATRDTLDVTQTSSITGTPLYMSPESVRDASSVSMQSDIYSVGAVGYHLLAGMPIFEGENPADVCAKQLHVDPLRPSERVHSQLPEDLQNILMACLRKDPADRPASTDDLAQALSACQHAHLWTSADACQWWKEVYDGPRDSVSNFADTGERETGSVHRPVGASDDTSVETDQIV